MDLFAHPFCMPNPAREKRQCCHLEASVVILACRCYVSFSLKLGKAYFNTLDITNQFLISLKNIIVNKFNQNIAGAAEM